jgi:FG-GAP repeat
MYRRQGDSNATRWSQEALLIPKDSSHLDFFGIGMAMYRTHILIGANGKGGVYETMDLVECIVRLIVWDY